MSHENDVYTKAVQADSSITGRRWCSNCQYGKDYRNGAWIEAIKTFSDEPGIMVRVAADR